jgi:hypothetical protein
MRCWYQLDQTLIYVSHIGLNTFSYLVMIEVRKLCQ